MRRQVPIQEKLFAIEGIHSLNADLSSLSPVDAVNLLAYTHQDGYPVGPAEGERLRMALDYLPKADAERASQLIDAAQLSSSGLARSLAVEGEFLRAFTPLRPDEAYVYWDRAIRDESAPIREKAYDVFTNMIGIAPEYGVGLRDFENVDDWFQTDCGLSVDQAYNITLSGAYATGGQNLYSPGRLALERLLERRGE